MKTKRLVSEFCYPVFLLIFGCAMGTASGATRFLAEKSECVAKKWNGKSWEPESSAGLSNALITERATPANGKTRFKIGSTWYSTASACLQGERAPASLEAQSVSDQSSRRKKGDRGKNGLVARGALEFASFSRSLGVGSSSYRVNLSTLSVKGGLGMRSFLSSGRVYVGWNLDAFAGRSGISAESSSPVSYQSSGVLTLGSRATGVMGYQVGTRFSSQVELGGGFSYAKMVPTDIANTTAPKAFDFFPMLRLAGVYQIRPRMGVGVEVMSQGVMRDFAFSGGVQWVL